jgi:5-methylthioadenosine/S-adenosylhomocysteine deaminase
VNDNESGVRPALLIHGATILTADEARPVVADGWLAAGGDGRISALGSGEPPADQRLADEVIDVGGAFVAPGFVSAHSHLFTSGSRGLATDQTLYGWATAMYDATRAALPDEIYWCTLHGALDHLNAGVTTVYDFANPRLTWEAIVDGKRSSLGRLRPPEFASRQVDAKVDAGIRFFNSVHLDESAGSDDEIMSRLTDIVTYTSAVAAPAALGTAITGAAQWALREDTAELEVEAMRRFGLLNQAHLLETREGLEQQRSRFGWYDRAGALCPTMLFGHFIHTTPAIVARVSESGSGMSWQPVSNGRLASGVADIPGLRRAGVRIGMGLDDASCSDLADPWQNMRMGLYLSRATTGRPQDLSPADVLRLHTAGSAELLGLGRDVGTIAVGKYADLLVVDPRQPDVGPVRDPVASYVLAMSLRNLKRVIIGGTTVSVHGRACTPLAEECGPRLHEVMDAMRAR